MADRRGYTSLYQNIPVQPLAGYSDPSAFIRVREAVRGLEDQVNLIRGTVGNSVPGYVSSVGLTAPTIFSVTGSPVTDTGTIALSLVSQTARSVFAAPTGLAGTPSFRALEAADIQSGVFGITRGGTGLSSTPTNGQLLIGNGSGYTLATLTAGTGISITNGVGSIQIDNSLPGFLNPMTTLGDVIYGGAAGAATRLGGETTTTRKFLRSVGVAGAATAPAWDTVTKTDVGLSNVENTALSTWAGSTNLTTLGTVTTGTWSATSIAPAKGGTGLTTAPAQDVIVYGGGSLSFSTLAPPSSGTNVLTWTSGIGITWTTKQVGTVTSVGMTVPTGLSVTPSTITTSGTFAVSYAAGYSIPLNTSQTNWDTAYTDRLKWDGGSGGLVASTGRTSLGATTVGSNLFTLTNPSAVTFLRVNADNTVSTLDAATFRTAIGAGTGDMTNPMTTIGDMIYASNTATPATPARLGLTTGGVMYGGASAPAWTATSDATWDQTNKRFGLGASSPQVRLHVDGTAATLDTDLYNNTDTILAVQNGGTGFRMVSATADPTNIANVPAVVWVTGRGTVSAATAVSSGDYLGRVLVQGIATGGGRAVSSELRAAVDAAPGTSFVPGRFEFFTTNSSGAQAERMRLDSSGRLGLGNTSPSYLFDVAETSANAATAKIMQRNILTMNPTAVSIALGDAFNSQMVLNGSTNNFTVRQSAGTFSVSHTGTGTVTRADGVTVLAFSKATAGTITALSAFRADSPSVSSGTVTASYGLYVDTMKTAGVTTGYGVYQASTSDLNILAGSTRVGNTTNPTALLHLAAGTATASTAPLKFTSGTNLSTPEAGTMEFDGTYLYFTPVTTRQVLATNPMTTAGDLIYGGTPSGGVAPATRLGITSGGILYGTTTAPAWTSASDLTWDQTNKRLGIGIAAPSYILDVAKAQNASTESRLAYNTDTGTAARSVGFVSTAAASMGIYAYSSGYTTSGAQVTSGTALAGSGSGGMSIVATDSSAGQIRLYAGGTASTNERMRVALAKNLTNNTATTVISLTLGTNTYSACSIIYTIEANNATDYQAKTGIVHVAAARAAGAGTTQFTDSVTTAAVTAGTLASTWAATYNAGAGTVDVTLNANSSLTPTTLRVRYVVVNNGSNLFT